MVFRLFVGVYVLINIRLCKDGYYVVIVCTRDDFIALGVRVTGTITRYPTQ